MLRRLAFAASLVLLAGCTQPAPATTRSAAVVFFTADSAALDQPAQDSIREAAATARANGPAVVHVRGFAAPDTGTAAFNHSLAQTRAQAVADGLVAAGVARERIRIESRGAASYESMPTESRRVDVVVGG